jgi:amino acid transporter
MLWRMSTKSRQGPHQESTLEIRDRRGLWGALAGLVTAVLIAYPLSASIAFATHPATQALFGGRLEDASQVGFRLFWWVMALACLALPFIVGFGIAKLSARTVTVIGAVVVILLILLIVLGQLFAF